MRINAVRSAMSYQVNQHVATTGNGQQAAFAKPQPAQDRGIIIVGGKPRTQGEDRGIIIVGGKTQSPAEDRGIIIVGGNTDNRIATQNGILFVGGLSVIR